LTPKEELRDPSESRLPWYQKPTRLAAVAGVMVIALNIIFW
jgi:SSS family solute:Na+ symporter